MKVKCDGCGSFHTVSPTAMAVIIRAFQRGDLQRVTTQGVDTLCLGDAFDDETMGRLRMDAKTVVTFDGRKWTDTQRLAEAA